MRSGSAFYFDSFGLPTSPTEFDGRSDYAFINAGSPAGGLFTGAEGIKTAEEAAIYGGTPGEPQLTRTRSLRCRRRQPTSSRRSCSKRSRQFSSPRAGCPRKETEASRCIGNTWGVEVPEIRYAKSGDVHIAYRVEGDGPFDLVVVPPLIWPIDILGSEPEARASFQRLASFSRVIVFDKRGMGSSDRVSGAPSLEERMDDVRAVMDEVGSSCAALLGAADGGSMSLLFAATYPERVFALALFRAKPRYVWAPDFPWAPSREAFDRETDELLRRRLTMRNEREMYEWRSKHRAEWSYTPQTFDEWLQESRMARLGVSPGALLAMRAMNRDIDVRAVLPVIHVPTLLMYRGADAPDASETGDEPMAKYMAERIPHAEVVEVAPRGHWHEAILPPLQPFLEEAWHAHDRRQTESQRVLATVLFTDLVGSTTKAVELGPRWHELLRDHNAAVRRELARYSGREIDTAGDGFFASGFDGPARAIRCACAIRDRVHDLGLAIRLGVHTGECEVVDDRLSGLAVVIGSRVADQAAEGEVLVSGTVRDLVAGSGIEFEPRGVHELKGLGEWPLYAVAAA
jgi:class 3 adenylate cyclase